MKQLLSISILLIISLNGYSQNYDQRLDSLEFEIRKIENIQTNIVNQIDLHQKRYRIGAFVSILGIGTSIASAFLLDINSQVFYVGAITGSVLGITGYFISVDSFDFLKKDFSYSDFLKSRYESERIQTNGNN